MHVHDDYAKWVDGTLDALDMAGPPCCEDKCPHCGLVVRYPVFARQSDLDNFALIMDSAFAVMERHGITAALLSEIRADCLIAKAKREGI